MPDLGAIGRRSLLATAPFIDAVGPRFHRGSHIVRQGARIERITSGGNPGDAAKTYYGIYRSLYVPIDSGAHTIRIDCKHPNFSPTPRLIVKANTSIGVNADVVAEAPADTLWNALNAAVSPTSSGALELHLEVRANRPDAYALWDNLQAT